MIFVLAGGCAEVDTAAVAAERKRRLAAQLADFESLGDSSSGGGRTATPPPAKTQVGLDALHLRSVAGKLLSGPSSKSNAATAPLTCHEL